MDTLLGNGIFPSNYAPHMTLVPCLGIFRRGKFHPLKVRAVTPAVRPLARTGVAILSVRCYLDAHENADNEIARRSAELAGD